MTGSPLSAARRLACLAGAVASTALAAGSARAEIVTASTADNSVTIHAVTASGNTAPVAKITGSNTGINVPFGVAVDPARGEIFVASFSGDAIRVFRAWDHGNAVPVRTIAGASTLLNSPIGIVYDAVNEELVVRNFSTPTNPKFPPGGIR